MTKNKFIKCLECGKELKRISNTHLKKCCGLTMEEYKLKYPNTKTVTDDIAHKQGNATRGKTYEEIYGNEKANKLKNKKSEITKQTWQENKSMVNIKKRSLEKKLQKQEEKEIIKKEKLEKKERICNYCGNEYILNTQNRNEKYCNHECYVAHIRKNAKNYRIKAFANLPNYCDICGDIDDKENLIVHHKDRNQYNNEINNLQILCNKCHSKQHKKENAESRKNAFKSAKISRAWRDIIDGLGLDVNDPNFVDTPRRIINSYYEIFEGLYNIEEISNILGTSFPSTYEGMVVIKDIKCYSMCPHHFLPVEYIVNFGYIPDKDVLGISKLARLVQLLAKKPALQEDFTKEIIEYLVSTLNPKGSIVQVKGRHMCMTMRGVKENSAWTHTSNIQGNFNNPEVRNEYLMMVK